MKAEENQSKKDKKPEGFSNVVKAFAIGAATGLSVGMYISSDKGVWIRKKLKGYIEDFGLDLSDQKK